MKITELTIYKMADQKTGTIRKANKRRIRRAYRVVGNIEVSNWAVMSTGQVHRKRKVESIHAHRYNTEVLTGGAK